MKQFDAHFVVTILRLEDWEHTLYSKGFVGDSAEYHYRQNARSLRNNNPHAVTGDSYNGQVQVPCHVLYHLPNNN
jgi:hypothetical protein